MKKLYYKWIQFASAAFGAAIFLTGCTSMNVIEKDDGNQVIQTEFTQSAEALTNELNDYELIDELYIEDESDNLLEKLVIDYLRDDPEIKNHKLDIEGLDLKIFKEDDGSTFFIALMLDNKGMPGTLFGKIHLDSQNQIVVEGEHLASYAVNMPKTSLLKGQNDWAIVSERPFSTFEECYFFMMDSGALKMYKRGWHDASLLYYSNMQKLLEQDKLDEAMALPDDSMYPMGYEQELFETANMMIRSSFKFGKQTLSEGDPVKASKYLVWALDYYFQNHYGRDTREMTNEGFEAFTSDNEELFGGDYLLSNDELKEVLTTYANLLGKTGKEKEAEALRQAMINIK